MHGRFLLLSAAALSGFVAPRLSGQAVVPQGTLAQEGNAVGGVSGFSERSHSQYVFHERVLRNLDGKSIRGLRFRRDEAGGTAYTASVSQLTVRLTLGAVAPALAGESFAGNRPTTAPVFTGAVSLPASPALSGSTTWGARHTVVISFSRSVPYRRGQHVCIDIEGQPSAFRADFGWPVDFESRSPAGRSEVVGKGCGAVAAGMAQQLFVSPTGLVAGANMRIVAHGRVNTPGFLMLGPVAARSAPLDVLGMTGCTLYVTPRMTIPMTHGAAAGVLAFPSANPHLALPRQSAILGAQFGMQAANLESGGAQSNSLGVTTTNALRLTVAPGLADPDWTSIRSDRVPMNAPLPSVGTVRPSFVPAVRFDY